MGQAIRQLLMLSTQPVAAAARATPSVSTAVKTANNEGECETPASCTRSCTSEDAIQQSKSAAIGRSSDPVAWRVAPRQAVQQVLPHQQVGKQDMQRKQAHQRLVGSQRLPRQKPTYHSGSIRKNIETQEQQHLRQHQFFEYEREPFAWSTTCPQVDIFSGLLRLKDGLFLSSPSVADEKGFLEANKVSHIVAIEEGFRQFSGQQGTESPDDPDSNLPARSLTLYWRLTEEAGDPVLLETRCTRRKRCFAFPSCYCPSCYCSHFSLALELREGARHEFCLFAPKPPTTNFPALSPQVSVDKRLRDVATTVAFIDEACEQGGSCLLHSSNELATAAAAAAAYFVVK